MNLKNNKGITLIALTITIIVLLILASITIYTGSESIKKAQLESLKTNMLLIKAKAKEYVEQASFKNGVNNTNIDEAKKQLQGQEESADSYNYISLDVGQYLYNVNDELSNLGLKDVKVVGDEKYLVKYDIKNVTVEVYNTKGYDGKHSLTDLEDL